MHALTSHKVWFPEQKIIDILHSRHNGNRHFGTVDIMALLKYVFENIMENGEFAHLEQIFHFHDISKIIHYLT